MKNKIVFAVLPLLLLACAAKNRQMHLDDTLRYYENAIRWGHFSDAHALRKEHGTVPDLDYLQDIKVTAYEPLGGAVISEEGKRIDRTVKIRYYHQDYGTEQVVMDKQVWRYDEDNGAWLLEGEMPDFKPATR